MMQLNLLVIAIVAVLINWAEGYSITLTPDLASECYLADANSGFVLSGTFEVIQGNAESLIVAVTGPKGFLHYESKKKDGIDGGKDLTEGSFQFDADLAGKYKMCLELDDDTDLTVAFNFRVQANDEQDYEYAGLNAELAELQEGLDLLRDHLSYMSQREDVHKNALSRIDTKVLFWSILEAMILVGMGVWQIGYISSFFETKRRM